MPKERNRFLASSVFASTVIRNPPGVSAIKIKANLFAPRFQRLLKKCLLFCSLGRSLLSRVACENELCGARYKRTLPRGRNNNWAWRNSYRGRDNCRRVRLYFGMGSRKSTDKRDFKYTASILQPPIPDLPVTFVCCENGRGKRGTSGQRSLAHRRHLLIHGRP
jgi:hypothetical protein